MTDSFVIISSKNPDEFQFRFGADAPSGTTLRGPRQTGNRHAVPGGDRDRQLDPLSLQSNQRAKAPDQPDISRDPLTRGTPAFAPRQFPLEKRRSIAPLADFDDRETAAGLLASDDYRPGAWIGRIDDGSSPGCPAGPAFAISGATKPVSSLFIRSNRHSTVTVGTPQAV
ncbi:MAG: hypothetical protein R2849_13055 [Thermomicrobiales bacterium]